MASPDDLRARTKRYAISVVKLVDGISESVAGQVIVRQLIRSATSVGANYRSACRARSKAEFIAKLQICLEESDESLYWLELMTELRLTDGAELESVTAEGNELTAIFVTALKTARNHNQ
ncbi:MAG TPA: four helix bundle protein [Bacteroidota bacterium]